MAESRASVGNGTSASARYFSSSDESEGDLLMSTALMAAAVIYSKRQRRHKRTRHSKSSLKHRSRFSAYTCLLQEFGENGDPNTERTFLRMSPENFQELLQKVQPLIKKRDTLMRTAIEPSDRLAITLRYLGSGMTFADMKYLFKIPESTIHKVVLDTCKALYAVLKDNFLKVPNSSTEWLGIADRFNQRWVFPNCVGAVDGKHVEIKLPGGAACCPHQGFSSIVLLLVTDADYRIVYYDIGAHGSGQEGGLIGESLLSRELKGRVLSLPEPQPLPGRQHPVPFFLAGNETFGLKPYLMKAYPNKPTAATALTVTDGEAADADARKQKIFNYRLSRVRRLADNVFGVLASRFGVFQQPMRLNPERATSVTLACLALHNFLLSKRDHVYMPPVLVDREDMHHRWLCGQWRRSGATSCFRDLDRPPGQRSTPDARWVRAELKEYVNLQGSVSWQEQLILGTGRRLT